MSDEVRAELLSADELDAAIHRYPLAYLPLGSLEFHGPHLPVGLDALNAHGVCVRAAQRTGGVVLPALYQGIGGLHGGFPWSLMMESPEAIRANLITTLTRLEQLGLRGAVLFSGHFAGEQIELIDELAGEWNSVGRRGLHIVATSVARCPTAPIAPDHAGVFETTLLHALHPDLVHLEQLPPVAEHPALDPAWGIYGPDPRSAELSSSDELLDAIVAWLASLVGR